MAYDPDCTAYWCDKCGKEMTIAVAECSEEVLVLKCQGNLQGGTGCGATRDFVKSLAGPQVDVARRENSHGKR